MSKLLVVAVAGTTLLAPAAWSASNSTDTPGTPTFAKDVLPIMQTHCQECHRSGGLGIAGAFAPMPLVTFDEVRPYARSVARMIQGHQMPPWDATAVTNGQFENERLMSDAERETIVQWVQAGAPEGDPSQAPPPVVWEEKQGWLLGPPDLVVSMPEPYWVADEHIDHQPRVTFEITEEMLPEPRWVRAVEVKPGPLNVHHIVAMAIAPAIGDRPQEVFSAGSIAAGEDPIVYPEGFGNLLRAGTRISMSLHYFKEAGPGTGFFDQSSIGFYFHSEDADIQYTVARDGIAQMSWEIPPGHPNWKIGSSRIFDEPTILVSLHPHMHFRGESMKYTAYYPDGTKEVLLDVPTYDYGWQTQYTYREPKYIPPGTRIEVFAVYDNSESKKAQFPYLDIEQPVNFGERSIDEMYIPYLEWSTISESDIPKYQERSPRGELFR
jgi:hypothetical protein